MSKENKRFYRWLFVIILIVINYMLVNGNIVNCTQKYGYPLYFVRRNIAPEGCAPVSTSYPYAKNISFSVPGSVIDFASWVLLSAAIVGLMNREKR